MPERRFVDANIFINWLKATPEKAVEDEAAAISGYILSRIEDGEEALTTVAVKDEVSIWLSRYRAGSPEPVPRALLRIHNPRSLARARAPCTSTRVLHTAH